MKAVLYGFGGLPWAEHHKNENHHFSKELNKQRSGYNSYFDIVERCQKMFRRLILTLQRAGAAVIRRQAF